MDINLLLNEIRKDQDWNQNLIRESINYDILNLTER